MKRVPIILIAIAVVLVPAIVWAPEVIDSIKAACTPAPSVSGAMVIGERLDGIDLIGPDEQTVRIEAATPGKVTVFWFWSTLCPCVGDCEKRILALLERYPERMRFVAVDPHPQDTRKDIEALRTELGSPYGVYREPSGAIVRRIGARSSASVAVFDETGALRFRGAIDDDLNAPTVSYIERAIDGILAKTSFEPVEPEVYGCQYPTN